MKNIDIYTDGACSGNPGPGGYGVVMLYQGHRKEMQAAYKITTNNRMEILAAVVALETLKEPCNVRLFSDSRYLVDAIEKGWVTRWQQNNWKRNKTEKALNIDLWERLLPLLDKHNVEFVWVRGHASNVENNRCDELATGAISAARENGGFVDDEGYEGK
ncbi:MAG: ribonuclease HI [Defluviitaleaceae bacterium]|nr:ribonuclease HI [Defluviitaleaceae bacterium]